MINCVSFLQREVKSSLHACACLRLMMITKSWILPKMIAVIPYCISMVLSPEVSFNYKLQSVILCCVWNISIVCQNLITFSVIAKLSCGKNVVRVFSKLCEILRVQMDTQTTAKT